MIHKDEASGEDSETSPINLTFRIFDVRDLSIFISEILK
jgi:hypothetical protein